MVRKQVAHRQRIGPQIRLLRQERNLTLDELAHSAGLSASHLSRLERSQTLPSFTVLAQIAQALGASIDEFVQLERDLEVLDDELSGQIDLFALNPMVRDEILNLSIESRRALSHKLRDLSDSQLTKFNVQERIADTIQQKGLTSAWSDIDQITQSDGLNAIALSRAFIRFLDTPGPRDIILTDKSILALSNDADIRCVYHQQYPQQPLDPAVAGWWHVRDWLNGDQHQGHWPTRMILSESLFERWSSQDQSPDNNERTDIARRSWNYWYQRIMSDTEFQIAVTGRDLGTGNTFIAREGASVLEHHPDTANAGNDARCGLWLSGHQFAETMAEQFQRIWDQLSAEERDQDRAREWLEHRINQVAV